MPRPRGVRYDVVRLDLSEGDWIDVKKTLTVGEERDIASLAVRGYARDGKVDIDAGKLSFLTAAHYLVNWSFLNLQGQAIVWPGNVSIDKKIDVLRTLDAPTMREIEAALEAHRMATQAAEEERKNGEGATGSGSSSASVA